MKTLLCLLLFALLHATTLSAQRTILWEIKRPSSQKVSYLLGTFHQMGNSFVDDRPIIRSLLLKSDVAVFESVEDIASQIIAVMVARAADSSYKIFLDPTDVTFLERLAAAWAVPLSKQKPAELLVKLQQTYVEQHCGTVKPTDSFKHMDNYLLKLAQRYGKRTVGLETYSDQFNAINSAGNRELTWDKAKDAIHFWVENFGSNKSRKDLCARAKEYLRMKFDYQFNTKCAENDAMVENRNEKWLSLILKHTAAGDAFIAVGLLHLYGECGIITQLRNGGYEVNTVVIE